MNEIFTVTKWLQQKFQDNPIVNTVTFDKTTEMDMEKTQIYPIVNIDIIDTDPIDEIITINYIITVLQERDIDDEMNNDKQLWEDNVIDNLSECHKIISGAINNLKYQENDLGINIERQSNIEFLRKEVRNTLDGVRLSLSLSIENSSSC
jgi:hypothetical protein